MEIIHQILENFMFMIVFFLCLISFILIYSLMQSDVEERTYEFAMLRTLGLKNKNLIVLLLIQSLMFSIPGLLLGFIINFIC
jgi:ABC-type antimicrobial peptide transport system permease subunit